MPMCRASSFVPRRVLAVFFAWLALAGPGLAAGPDCGLSADDAERVRQLARDIVERGHAPGVVVDLRCQGRRWIQLSTGQADIARARPMQADDLFRIYSMTKPLTSLLALMLVEDGRLSLDDPVALHLPEFAQAAVHSGSKAFPPERVPLRRAVTVRDLLRHTAGMTYLSATPDPVTSLYVQKGIDHGGGNKIVPSDGSAPVASLQDLTQRLASVPLMTQPGARFTYGNATDVLGRVVEVASGQPLRELMASRLLHPLGMRDTSFQVNAQDLGRLTAAYMAPSQVGGTAILRRPPMQQVPRSAFTLADDPRNSVFASRRVVDFGGAGLVSTAADYQRFLRLMLQGGEVDGMRLVRRDTLAAMTINQLEPAALRGTTLERDGLGFGLGFATFLAPEQAPAAVPRDGYFWGGAASTYFWVDPARRITGVFMAQVFGGDVAPYFMELLDTLYRPRPAAPRDY
jgi:CubicO group peptidase (beta-lactamase class C family)